MAVEREDKHGRIKTDQYRADIACTGRTGPGAAEASEKIADKPAGDRDMVSDRRRNWILVDAALMFGIKERKWSFERRTTKSSRRRFELYIGDP
jgi:hypothetical protein